MFVSFPCSFKVESLAHRAFVLSDSQAIMRSFSLLQESIVPYIPTLIGQLTHKLLQVSKVGSFVWKMYQGVCLASKNLWPPFRIPANLTSITTCLSPCACRCGSPAKPTPPRSAASRKRSSPSSRRSFRTMCRVCLSPVDTKQVLL